MNDAGTLRMSLSYTPYELNFGTSGLRGLVTDMTDLECYINTRGFLHFLTDSKLAETGQIVYLAGDLRESTPRIMTAVAEAISDAGFRPVNCGLIPTAALAHYAFLKQAPSVMVTGSHIPADRNGIKFYKPGEEVLKTDEAAVKAAVVSVRDEIYGQVADEAKFSAQGSLKQPGSLPPVNDEARALYLKRYTDSFPSQPLAEKKIVLYQHSAVVRDMLQELLESLGANVTPVGRSETFVPIDTENVTDQDRQYFKKIAEEYPDAFAIISTDGDSDRPFVVDERGEFQRGDVLGAVVSQWLRADFAAFPVSTNDAVDTYMDANKIEWRHTRIGSPYVIAEMKAAAEQGKKRVVGWEANGGYLTGSDIEINGRTLTALATRDAILPILVALVSAVEKNKKVSELFSALPQRFTQAGLVDNFPVEKSKRIIETLSEDSDSVREKLSHYFSVDQGFGRVREVNSLDGVRIFFDNGDIIHLRPSGNAPQFRVYSVANSQQRADEIVRFGINEPDGILRAIGRDLG